jgi:Protein of unknown function (DUF2950)
LGIKATYCAKLDPLGSASSPFPRTIASGVMTFFVDQNGVIYQKDLGDKTAGIAEQMSSYDRDKTGLVVK